SAKKSAPDRVETGRTPCGEPATAPLRSDGGRPAGPSPKIVLLRGRGGAGPVAQPPGAEDLRLDLQGPIDGLRSIRGDLELYYWERPGHGEQHERERYQVSLWIRQVTERTAALEGILLHMGTPALVLNGVGTGERGPFSRLLDPGRGAIRAGSSHRGRRAQRGGRHRSASGRGEPGAGSRSPPPSVASRRAGRGGTVASSAPRRRSHEVSSSRSRC